MVDPGFALTLFAIAAAITAVLVWPGRGVAWRMARVLRSTERVQLEDALKHLVHCEREGRSASPVARPCLPTIPSTMPTVWR